jgi:hypothetical protein
VIQQYVPPEKDALEQAHHKCKIIVRPAPNAQGEHRLVISNCSKPGDNMGLGIDKAKEKLTNLSIGCLSW